MAFSKTKIAEDQAMVDDRVTQETLPEGRALLDMLFKNQDKVEAETSERLTTMGAKAPVCYAEMGTVIGYLDRMASCWWGCPGGHHRIEYLCGRATAQILSALRLMQFGSYDEALLLCRGVGEIANLLFLFRMEPRSFEEWMNATEGQRRKNFSPFNVRMRLSSGGLAAPIDEHRYRRLSGLAAHVSPETLPQAHNLLGRPGVGLGWQESGVLVCINELATALALVTIGGSFVLGYDKELKEEIHQACRALVENIGEVDLALMERINKELRESPAGRAAFQQISKAISEAQAANPRRTSSPSAE